ncbi:hypothetical protein [Pseudobacteriovorax antillogorgiicola]|uniref:Long-chain fatty acid transport protein n=1 Tax=Pseudobacteriovorax antillogorgiicola TaxID=1513793 RepID=A0A1Y6B7L5_9BACT|nr:hypothetical protein [Pseudobacteriovorax antillogorgiicola]TCS58813.1 long-subunit fatty acid transport protein [Pseudobacteriovorax antillogorgiicola]SME94393.1 Long-chain fatty acid transport protein [Pseudobacteriovorax antillogorgiicola]
MIQRGIVFGIGLVFSQLASADIFHYNNLLIGERAMGLGGAFTAVADDASGVLYNPAGIAFAISNDISGSANAFYQRRVVYRSTIGQEDFTEKSSGTTAPFFGSLLKVDDLLDDVVVAFGVYNLDSELKNQNDFITNESLGLLRFHRTSNVRAGTMGVGLAAARRILPGVSIGFAMNGIDIDELIQEYQHVAYTDGRFLAQNVRTHLQVNAIGYTLGGQMALGQFSLGASLKYTSIISESYDEGIDQTKNFDDILGTNEILPIPLEYFSNEPETEPLKTMPIELRLGSAWFASARLLVTFDATYVGAAKQGSGRFDREAVTNFATGAEYYITPSVPVRVGLFTNNDARPEVVEGQSGQADHIDYVGTSLFFAWVQPNSQVSIGSVYQVGEGKAQKITGSAIQDVEAESITLAFSATHSF